MNPITEKVKSNAAKVTATWMKARLKEKGLKKKDFAEQLGVKGHQISLWLKTNPNPLYHRTPNLINRINIYEILK